MDLDRILCQGKRQLWQELIKVEKVRVCPGKQLCRFRRRNHQGMLKSINSRKCPSPKSLETGGSQSINQ